MRSVEYRLIFTYYFVSVSNLLAESMSIRQVNYDKMI